MAVRVLARAKSFVMITLLMRANQPPENPVLQAIAVLPVEEEDDDGVPLGKRGKI